MAERKSHYLRRADVKEGSFPERIVLTHAIQRNEPSCKALTAWLVDAVAAYIRNLLSAPTIITNPELMAAIRGQESVEDKICVLAATCGEEYATATLLVRTAVVWRNRLVHYQARNKVDRQLVVTLQGRAAEIKSDYHGLEVNRLLDSVDKSHAPTFKEVTSLVRAAHTFVERADDILLRQSDLDQYVRQVLMHYVSDDPIRRISNVWGKDSHRRLASLAQICRQYGMTTDAPEALNHVSEDMLQQISAWSPAQARTELYPEL
ncbi:MAG: hypothetical protein ACRDNF_03170 [Streptosporangiaceae bacterium]